LKITDSRTPKIAAKNCQVFTSGMKKQYNSLYFEFGGSMLLRFARSNFFIYFIFFLVFAISPADSASRNLLPRFPEIVIEKGFSENFEITDCSAKVRIIDNDAQSNIKLTLKNRSAIELKSSVKFRILYPTSENQVRIKVNGSQIKYNRGSPRHSFVLPSQQSIDFEISAKTSVNYSKDSVREALRKESEEQQKKGKKFDLSGLMKLFDREKFGKRFLVGPIASKWGVFPLDFQQVNIEVHVPSDFSIVSPETEKWSKKDKGKEISYSFKSTEGFAGAVFLPENEKEEFIKTQEILTSSDFMH
jgi:hypothetical protein